MRIMDLFNNKKKRRRKIITYILIVVLLVFLSLFAYSYFFNGIKIYSKLYIKSNDYVINNLEVLSNNNGIKNGESVSFNIKGSYTKDLVYVIRINDINNTYNKDDVIINLEKIVNKENVNLYTKNLNDLIGNILYVDTISNYNYDKDIDVEYKLTFWIRENVDNNEYKLGEYKFNVDCEVYDNIKSDYSITYNSNGNEYKIFNNYKDLEYTEKEVDINFYTKDDFYVNNIKSDNLITVDKSGTYSFYSIKDNKIDSIGYFNVKIDKVNPVFYMDEGESKTLDRYDEKYTINNELTNLYDDNDYLINYYIYKNNDLVYKNSIKPISEYTINYSVYPGLYKLVVEMIDDYGRTNIMSTMYEISYNLIIDDNSGGNVNIDKRSMKVIPGTKINYLEELNDINSDDFKYYAYDIYGEKKINKNSILDSGIERIYVIWNSLYTNIKISKELVCRNAIYNGNSQKVTNEVKGLSFKNNYGTYAGTYQVEAILDDDYVWEDGTRENKIFNCEIGKIKILYKTNSSSKIYDGKRLIDDNYTLIGNLASTDSDYLIFNTSIINVGSVSNKITSVNIKNINKKDVTNNYDIEYDFGTLTILPKEVKIPSNVCKHLSYNGKEQTITNDNQEGYYYVENTGINAGTYNLKIRLNSNYIWNDNTLSDKDASCTINKINLVVTSLSSTKHYDGSILVNDNYSVNGSVLKDNKLYVTITGKISEIGEVPNTIEKVIVRDKYSRDVTSNYDITIKEGTLTIIK